MSTHLKVTSIRIEQTANGWCVIRHENGEVAARQDFTSQCEAESWAECQRILMGNYITQGPPAPRDVEQPAEGYFS